MALVAVFLRKLRIRLSNHLTASMLEFDRPISEGMGHPASLEGRWGGEVEPIALLIKVVHKRYLSSSGTEGGTGRKSHLEFRIQHGDYIGRELY